MPAAGGLESYRLTKEDEFLLQSLGFKIIAEDVEFDALDLKRPEIAALKDKKSVYFWRMRHGGEVFKIYVGKTNSLPRRLREYSNKFQPGVPNDFKLRHFQSWSRQQFPGSALDLLAVQRDDHQAIETEVWRKTKPLINERAGVCSQALKGSHFAYYKNIFESKIKSQGATRLTATPLNKRINKVRLITADSPVHRETNHELIAKALKAHSGRELETKQFNEIILDAFPDFNEGSLLPNDHASGNKGACPCAGTESRLLDRLGRGLFRVR
jgi:hypothetical protein